ncbi:hypothetical protein GCM10010992_12820 [Cloacibacterium rupense]|uniref:Uncharacterized protein n=1 Tax=Cloacibacterium rupense TaxID=517423 RepID=A0ABQ2NIY0_9FLAO|nr:hypothetical protein [Cloacibacterium rupense]GGP03636.1 hypothetical protein GCM10010992_12820 [Cloacibacterium rupense]
MKELDLDKLERKTPYTTPENFFEEMQANVLKQTTLKNKKETKIFKLNFSTLTSMAASLVLVLGFTFLWKTNQADITTTTETDSVVNVKTHAKETNMLTNQDITTVTEVHQVAKEIQKQSETTKANVPTSGTASDIKTTAKAADLNYDQLLNSLTDEELKELSKNTDQDIYLELFN